MLILTMMGTSSSQGGKERKKSDERGGAHGGDTTVMLQWCIEGSRAMSSLWNRREKANEGATEKGSVYIVRVRGDR